MQDSSTSVCVYVCVFVNECERVSMTMCVRDETVLWSGLEQRKAIAFWVMKTQTHTHKVNQSGHRNLLLLC